MSLNHLLRFAKQLTIQFYTCIMNLIIILKLISWPLKYFVLRDHQQNLYKYAELLRKSWSKNLTCNQINFFSHSYEINLVRKANSLFVWVEMKNHPEKSRKISKFVLRDLMNWNDSANNFTLRGGNL